MTLTILTKKARTGKSEFHQFILEFFPFDWSDQWKCAGSGKTNGKVKTETPRTTDTAPPG